VSGDLKKSNPISNPKRSLILTLIGRIAPKQFANCRLSPPKALEEQRERERRLSEEKIALK
jgi:hypothetical protein